MPYLCHQMRKHFQESSLSGVIILLLISTFFAQSLSSETTININFAGLLGGVSSGSSSPVNQLNCELAIVGAGVGGTHTAYQLADLLGDKICIFESEDYVGGRTQDGVGPNGETVPLGALRVMESQQHILRLGNTLGIEMQYGPYQGIRYLSRGVLTDEQLNLKREAFPLLKDNLTVDDYWDILRLSPKRQMADKFLNFKDYVRDVIGNEAYNFLFSAYRFRRELQNIDTRGYLDFLDEEVKACCNAYYPVKGMSQFPKKMAENATQKGVRLFLSEPVISIYKNGQNLTLTTKQFRVNAKRVIITAPVDKVALLQGDVAKAIQNDIHFQAIQPVLITTINHIWPRRWWEEATLFNSTRRAWTTDNCINFIEIPVHPSGIAENRTRTVYDDYLCAQEWAYLLQTQPLSLINQRIVKMLRDIFPEVDIPMPIATLHKVWTTDWVFLNPNVPVTVRDIERWAADPFNGTSGYPVHLIGENYLPRKRGWIESAVQSSWNFLEKLFNMKRPVDLSS